MAMTKPTLDEMIEAAAKLPPGGVGADLQGVPRGDAGELIEKFRQSAELRATGGR